MKVIADFVDIRNGNRYGPGDWDKIDPTLDDDQIERLKKAGALSDGSEVKASASTGMRTEAGEIAARQADAEARDRSQRDASKETKQGDAAAGPAGGDDGVAGRTKHRHK